MTNIITANLSKCRFYRASPVYQYNYGMVLKITGIDLPTAYEVDFANDISGQSITQIGGADGVSIPSQYFVPGQAIYAWLRVHPTQDSGVTTAIIVIPISPRATITDDEPTPEEQSAIDQAIAALNDAVEHVDDAVEHYPQITNGVWYVWDVDAGEYVSTGIPAQGAQGNPGKDGNDGISPTITVAPISGGHRITITDANGTHTVDVLDGENGDAGCGIVSVQKTGTAGLVDTYTITYTDSTTSTFTVTNGQNGTDGISPSITVTDITGGHRVTITDATGAHSFDVMDGQDGQGAVQDVQVNGTSVVQGGVANIPVTNDTAQGLVPWNRLIGQGLYKDSYGYIRVNNATAAQAKSGNSSIRFVSTEAQHCSAFYGLAKAAGSDEKNSTLSVGQYTDAAKSAIQTMLGVNRAFELINQVIISEDRTAIYPLIISTDSNGQSFELDAVSVFISVPKTSATTMNGYFSVMKGSSSDQIGLRFNNFGHASYPMRNLVSASLARSGQITADLKSQINEANTSYLGIVKWTPEAITADYIYDFCIRDNTIPAGTVIEIWGHRI